MPADLASMLVWALCGACAGAVVFTFIGLIAGTSETATIAPATLLVALLGFPPVAVFSFCIAAICSKHIIHAAPTALLGIPGDTMAVPLLEPCASLKRLGIPHIALYKMISGGVVASILAIPISVGFATLLAPFADIVKAWAGAIFTLVVIIISYTSPGRWASLFMLIPFALILQGLNKLSIASTGKGVVICVFLGLAVGPMFGDFVTALSRVSRSKLVKNAPTEVWLRPALKTWKGFFPNPLRILTRQQKLYLLVTTCVSAVTFTFSPIAMTILCGQIAQAKIKSTYNRLTTGLAVMNGATESTYLAEVMIPLVAFGIPISPIAMGVAFPLFNAPPVFTLEPMHNLHTLMTPFQFLVFGLVAVMVAVIISYPLSMNYARAASAWVTKNVSQEAVLSMFAGLIVVLAYYEAGFIGVAISVTLGALGGILAKNFGINVGVQFMTYYASSWMVLQLFGVK